MKRPQVIRLQVLVLVLLTVLVIVRGFSGGSRPEGVIVFTGVESNRLLEGAFGLNDAAPVHISATGSVESRSDTSLAAYGWILDHQTREPVWVMSSAHSTPGNGLLVHADTTVMLPPGFYEVYFASFGGDVSARHSRSFFSRIFDDRSHWVNDSGDWELVVTMAEGPGHAFLPVSHEELQLTAPEPLWSSGPLPNRSSATELLQVRRPIDLNVYSIGEIDGTARDFGWMVRATSDDTLWHLSDQNPVFAGGASVNRLVRDVVSLDTGIHVIGYATDQTHAFGSWRANPPYDPYGWGLRVDPVHAADTAAVSRFDPWTQRQPAVSLAPVANDEQRSARIRIEDSTAVIVYGLGEIGRRRYDYGTLRSEADDRVIWEMTLDDAVPAGGHANNRRQINFLTLQPGDYVLEYSTDGSHAFGDWRNGEPDHPDRWGVTIFTMDGTALGEVDVEVAEPPSPVVTSPSDVPPAQGPYLVELTGVENDESISQAFILDQTTDVHVRALGEVMLSNRYDFAWIENTATGETVWEMTYENTEPGGGADRNRSFDGNLKLPPGRYRAHFQTDFSHAFGDFRDGEAPSEPEAWGITIQPSQ